MNVTFIGTGTIGSTKRGNTSVLVDNILFDCGMGIIKQLERQGNRVKDLDYLVLTHFHADHFFDLPNLIVGKKLRDEMDRKFYIVGPEGTRQKAHDMMSLSFGKWGALEEYANLEFIELAPNEKLDVNGGTLTVYELDHGDSLDYGYLLEKDGKCIGYTGDTQTCDNYYKMCEKADAMFTEATKIEKSKYPHMSVNEIIEAADKYPNCTFYAIHREDYEIPKTDKVKFPEDGDKIII